MSETLEWTNEEVIRLIKAYKAKGMLWDPNHDLYRVQTAKYEAWCELAERYGCEVVDLRKKFNSIFASHRREKAKIRHGGKSSWFLYNHLSFLPSHIYNEESETKTTPMKKPSVDEPHEPPDELQSDTEEYEDINSHSPVHIIVKEEAEIPDTPPKIYRPKSTRLVRKRKILHEDDMIIEKKDVLNRKMLKRSKFYKKKDECDSFGEYIAMSLRKHDDRTRSMIKQAINNILFEQEMKKYNSGHYAVIYTDENPLIVPDDK
ncbi:uncharacterized protein LOC112054521 [Bicyclus anynana]|uniref:Uncharacterized protein LOC112054521 n=1 Tax=Bicyclus anynana TaxID=110368 RepID=A0A6J1NQX0_BICAN|nr:uncharacterized protein LOC112054521 [Bicyclus anynana]